MKLKARYLILTLFLVFSVFTYSNTFESLESRLQDATYQEKSPVDSRIIILGIDDDSLEALGQWPWSRERIAELVTLLGEAKAAAVGIDIMYSENAKDPNEDAALSEAIKNAGNVVIPVYGDFGNQYLRAGEIKTDVLRQPIQSIREAAAAIGHINAMPDPIDGVVRRNFASFTYFNTDIESFAGQLYKLYVKNTGDGPEEIKVPMDAFNRTYITFTEGPSGFEHHSVYQVLNGDIPAEYFEGAIVLVGPYTVGMGDSYLTAIDPQSPMYGVEIHANIIQNYFQQNFKIYTPDWANLIILFAFALVSYALFRKISPGKSAIAAVVIIAAWFFAAKAVFGQGMIVPLLYPSMMVVAVYLALLGYRYLEEYMERRRITGVFGRYVAPQVVDEILKGGEEGLKLGGARREISALFVDIRGFTPMSERVEPEQVVEILNDYLNLTASSIFKYGGTLDKFIGDATMAIFNAPMDLEDHAFHAVQTAWAMKEGSLELQKGLEEKYGRSVQFGIGVNTGYAVVGNIGAKFRMDYTAIGDTVNTAARLESNAKPGQILISEATYERVKDRVLATSLGEIKVKGKEQGVPVYQLDGIRPEVQAGNAAGIAEKV